MKTQITKRERDDFLRQYYSENGADWCSERIGVNRKKIVSRANQMGIKLNRSVKCAIISRTRPQKTSDEYSVNPEQFFSIKTPEAAYILGLLWADGYVLHRSPVDKKTGYIHEEYRIQLGSTYDDFVQFLPILERVGRWRTTYIKASKRRKRQGKATISNRPLTDFLIANDYSSKSTASACKILSLVPDHLRHYWFRGLFDGDGCIYHNPDGLHIKLSICSSYDQDWTYIRELFQSVLNEPSFFIHRTVRKNGNRFSKVEVVKRSAILKFLNYIYRGYDTDGIGLKRKYDGYVKVVDRESECSLNRKA